MGQLESDLCVHDMVSMDGGQQAGGQQALLFPSEQEKLLESLNVQVSGHRNPRFRSPMPTPSPASAHALSFPLRGLRYPDMSRCNYQRTDPHTLAHTTTMYLP